MTTEYGAGEHQIEASLQAIRDLGLPAIVLWPNPDAGSDDIARGIRKWRERGKDMDMHFFKNLPIQTYVGLMKRTACLVGNSSSGIREGAFIGTPVVNVGTRQAERERGRKLINVDNNRSAIADAISAQLKTGAYDMDDTYGDGTAGLRIADILSHHNVADVQKRITY